MDKTTNRETRQVTTETTRLQKKKLKYTMVNRHKRKERVRKHQNKNFRNGSRYRTSKRDKKCSSKHQTPECKLRNYVKIIN